MSEPHDSSHASDAPADVPRIPIPTIERDELWAALQGPTPPALFEVLPRGYWLKQHLPGARNAPPDTAAQLIAELVPDPRTPIVLYCWDDT